MKIRTWKKLMVAVRDFDSASRALVRKAAALAQRYGATLDVLHVSAAAEEAFRIPGLIATPETATELAAIQQQRLEKLVAPLLKGKTPDLKVRCLSVTDYPVADAIVRQVLKHKPDLLIVHSQRHAALARAFLSNTDWELIRHCPCPLWLVRSNSLKPHLSVLAAIDPFHAFAKPADLDGSILSAAGQLVGTGAGRLGLCHIYMTPQNAVAAMGEVALVPATAAEERRHKARVTEATRKLSQDYAIARKDQLLIEGDAATTLPQAARRWKADVLVMGAVSRRGLKRIFIGNTAERVLDAVPCDVLVIKPSAFKTPVPRTPHKF